VFKKYGIQATPTTMILGPDGAEIDWIVGYGPPPENFQAKLEKVLKGQDTFKAVSEAYAKNPDDAALTFKLARKWGDRYDKANQAKSQDLYKKVIALDPEGKSGIYTNEYTKVTVPYTVFAEYTLATTTIYAAKPDTAAVKAFIAKYPESPLVKSAYSAMAYYYNGQAPKDEASAFFAEYGAKYPEDAYVLGSWLDRITKDEGPMDKGLKLAEKIELLTQRNPDSSLQGTLGSYYLLKGDKDKVAEVYGKDFALNQVQGLAYDLITYAAFWSARGANLDDAMAMAETALKLYPDNAYMLQQTASVYLKAGQESKAIALFGPDWAKSKMADASSLYSYASFWSRQGKNMDSALAAAKKAVELKPKQYYQWANLGDILGKLKNTAEAVSAYEKAIEMAPDQVKEMYKKTLDKIRGAQPADKK
jgi:tetratricopeptide (TPR) repeat protein